MKWLKIDLIFFKTERKMRYFILLFFSTLCQADTTTIWYISPQGNDSHEGSLSAPFATIQHGIEVAHENDMVLVQAGIYSEQINFIGKNITVASLFFTTGKTEYIEQTIIHGSDNGHVITFADNEKETVLLTGFTITHGKTTENGGGIYLTNNAQPRLENLIISQNQAVNGGGIAILRAKPTLNHLVIKENTAYNGGGIYMDENNKIDLKNNTITDNHASHFGGGIYSQKPLNLQLSQNLIANNKAEMGGGLYIVNTRGSFLLDEVQRNSIYDNYATQGRDIYLIQNVTSQPTTLYFDIFSVKEPTNYHVFSNQPLAFDIINAIYHQTDSDLYVSPQGSDQNDGITANKPLKTISTAISKLLITAPRTIYLQEGIYSPDSNGEKYPLVLPNNVSLQGDSENTTVLDAQQRASVIYLKDVQNTVLTDMTLTHGYAKLGGGIYIENANPTLQNLTITHNIAIDDEKQGKGGGIFSFNNQLVILKNSSVVDNQSTQGGGIYLENSSQSNQIIIENSILVDNKSEMGSGIFNQNSALNLINVTLANNNTNQADGGLYCIDCKIDIYNSVIWHETLLPIIIANVNATSTLTIDYSAIQQGQGGIQTDKTNLINWLAHNIDADPQFINPVMGNYQLQPTSPLLDAGSSENAVLFDRLGNERLPPIDIGAYEYQPLPACYYNVTLTTNSYTAIGGTGTMTVTTFDYCDWIIDLPDDTWIRFNEAKINRGTHTVHYTIAENSTAYQRNLQFTIAGKSINITQTGLSCNYTIQPNTVEYTAKSTTDKVTVTAPEGCKWTAGSNDAWISLISGNSGNSTDVVNYFITENNSPYPRQGTIKIADHLLIIKQSAVSQCHYQLEPTTYEVNAGGGVATIAVSTEDDCQWTAGSNDIWLSILSGNIGQGHGNVEYFIASNPNEIHRYGTLKIADTFFTVMQTDFKCNYQLNMQTNYYDAKTHEGSLNIITPHDCRWNITTDAAWINLISSNTGLGNATVRYAVEENDEQEKRTAILAVEDQTVKVTQLGKGPSYLLTVTPTEGGNIISTEIEHFIDCSEEKLLSCSAHYDNNEVVTLIAQNKPNWIFKEWTEDCQTTIKNPCILTMNSDKQVAARFESLQTYTNLYLEVSNPTILHKGQLILTGKLNRFPDRGEDLSKLLIQLTITAPDSSVITRQTTTQSDTGQYIFDSKTLPLFDQEGSYTFQTHFAETETLYASNSLPQSVLVGKSAGYAILIQGKIATEEGLKAHAKTLSRVRKTLAARGFESDNIHDLGYGNEQIIPNETAIQNAFNSLQKKVNGSPAPVYLIMVDHGGKEGEFYIDNGHGEKITPDLLNSWIKNFEMSLTSKAFIEAPRIIIMGACHSGAFIPALSGRERIIITSAAADEASYKGLLEVDGIRSGEFFIDVLFQQLGIGKSLKNAFELAAQGTEIYTRQGGISINTNALYRDDAVQHPLLDDNGDQRGSNRLEKIVAETSFNDGFGRTQNLYLGVGADTDINANELPADIISVTHTLHLKENQNKADLLIAVNNATRINSAPVDIRSPTIMLPNDNNKEYTEQLEIQALQRVFLSCSQETQTCHATTDDLFTEAGKYELFYFVRDNQTNDISPIKRSVIYKNHYDNHPPNSNFHLLAPKNRAETQTVLVFDWENTTDPDNDPVTYNLLIGQCNSKYNQIDNIIYQQEELVQSMSALTVESLTKINNSWHKGLQDQTRYCWQVEAVDYFGGISQSEVWTFKTNNPNAPFDVQSLNVVDILSNEAVKTANFSTPDASIMIYAEQDQALLTVPQGIKTLQAEISAPDYQATHVVIDATPTLIEQVVTLTPLATYSIETGIAYLPIVQVIGGGYYTVTLQAIDNDSFRLIDYRAIYQTLSPQATFNSQNGELSIPLITVKESPQMTYQVLLQQQQDVFHLLNLSLL